MKTSDCFYDLLGKLKSEINIYFEKEKIIPKLQKKFKALVEASKILKLSFGEIEKKKYILFEYLDIIYGEEKSHYYDEIRNFIYENIKYNRLVNESEREKITKLFIGRSEAFKKQYQELKKDIETLEQQLIDEKNIIIEYKKYYPMLNIIIQ